MESIGLRKSWFGDPQNFIRNKITEDKRAFDACRSYMNIGIGTEPQFNWNGYGKITDASHRLKAEILYLRTGYCERVFPRIT